MKDIVPLIVEHHREISHFKDIPLKIGLADYLTLESKGLLRLFTARKDETKELIGYAVFILRQHPHHATILFAIQDALFIRKSERGFGLEFIAWCDDQLAANDCEAVYQTVTTQCDFSKLLKRLGYEEAERVFIKRLKKNADKTIQSK